MAKRKHEALTVVKLINEILVNQLKIPFQNIANDITIPSYLGSYRPDILISATAYSITNEEQYVKNLLAYAEVKDNCTVNDKDWQNAISQGKLKALKLKLPYFIVTNYVVTYFYNTQTLEQLTLDGNPIREFQTMDIYRLIKSQLSKKNTSNTIITNPDSKSAISEAIFNKKLWELESVYREINFKNNVQKIDFTIGLIALEYFEEKQEMDGNKDVTKVYWSTCNDNIAEKVKNNLSGYISRLENETTFNEFKKVMEVVRLSIEGNSNTKAIIDVDNTKKIYNIVDSMKPLHGTGFDLFGAVYEKFASTKEKSDFGEYFTRRHYTHIFAKLLLQDEKVYNIDREFSIIDPACGTGGFLTESFKVLLSNYQKSGTLSPDAIHFLSKKCFYGVDVKEDNISYTKLNMFLVGDGHTHMYVENTLKPSKETSKKILSQRFQYAITNPPYGSGTIAADTNAISSTRREIAFICEIIKLLKIGGKGCIITPDGILENPSYKAFRNEILEKCDIYAIVSLPKFAFAPYTKEKTYALFIKKRSEKITQKQHSPIWMYIIDNDGFANSDQRFPTSLRDEHTGWLHNEILGWIDNNGIEQLSLLEKRWLTFDDADTNGTTWINEKGIPITKRKGGNISINMIIRDKYTTLLPEYYLRPYIPKYAYENDFNNELNIIKKQMEDVLHEFSGNL